MARGTGGPWALEEGGAWEMEGGGEEGGGATHLLDEQGVAEEAEAGAAVRLGDDAPEEAELAHPGHDLTRPPPLALPALEVGHQLALREVAGHLLHLELVRAQPETHPDHSPPTHSPMKRGARFSKWARRPSW